MSDLILWLDLETTGLDPLEHDILELGLVITAGLERIVDERSIVIDHGVPPMLLKDVFLMHAESGLLEDLRTHGVHPEIALDQAHDFLDTYFGDDRAAPITVGGSGIDRFDIPFLRRHAPSLADRFHFRTLDVSSIKELMRRNGLPVLEPSTAHRAVADATWAWELARSAVELMLTGEELS